MRVLPLKRFVDPSRPITYGIVQAGDDVEGGVPYIRPIDMAGHTGVPDASLLRTTSAAIAAAYRRSTVLQGDIVVSIGPSYGKTMEVPRELDGANLTQGTARVTPASGVDGRYIRWALQSQSSIAFWDAAVGGATFRALNLEPLSNTPIPLWPLASQRVVADFLDAETSRIDSVIAKKRRMIGLLDARDVSLAQAVVTGVRIEGERRDSGMPWLGSVPANWPTVSVSSQFIVQLGRMLNPERASSGRLRPYIRNVNVRWEVVDTTDLAEMDFPLEDRNRYLLRTGDLLVNEGGAGIGRAAIWHGEVTECYFQKSVHRLRPIGWTDPRWLLEWFRVVADRRVFLVEGNLATIPHIPAESLRVFRLPCPARSVQERLLKWAGEQRRLLTRMRQRVDGQLRLLSELRQALITAAVTGEIDIPGAAA